MEGRVEICIDNVWGTICGKTGWNPLIARNVCRQLGFLTMRKISIDKLVYVCLTNNWD